MITELESDHGTRCTFAKTGRNMVTQPLYLCVTCEMNYGQCLCENCARVCHKGHTIKKLPSHEGFCDCGAGDLIMKCKCMNDMSSNHSLELNRSLTMKNV